MAFLSSSGCSVFATTRFARPVITSRKSSGQSLRSTTRRVRPHARDIAGTSVASLVPARDNKTTSGSTRRHCSNASTFVAASATTSNPFQLVTSATRAARTRTSSSISSIRMYCWCRRSNILSRCDHVNGRRFSFLAVVSLGHVTARWTHSNLASHLGGLGYIRLESAIEAIGIEERHDELIETDRPL